MIRLGKFIFPFLCFFPFFCRFLPRLCLISTATTYNPKPKPNRKVVRVGVETLRWTMQKTLIYGYKIPNSIIKKSNRQCIILVHVSQPSQCVYMSLGAVCESKNLEKWGEPKERDFHSVIKYANLSQTPNRNEMKAYTRRHHGNERFKIKRRKRSHSSTRKHLTMYLQFNCVNSAVHNRRAEKKGSQQRLLAKICRQWCSAFQSGVGGCISNYMEGNDLSSCVSLPALGVC